MQDDIVRAPKTEKPTPVADDVVPTPIAVSAPEVPEEPAFGADDGVVEAPVADEAHDGGSGLTTPADEPSEVSAKEEQSKEPATHIEEDKKAESHQSHEHTPEVAEQPPKKKSTLPIPVIVVAFIICSALIGLSVWMAVSESNKAKKIDKQTKTTPTTTDTQQSGATTPDVQGALDESDTLPEATDDTTQLSDQALGL